MHQSTTTAPAEGFGNRAEVRDQPARRKRDRIDTHALDPMAASGGVRTLIYADSALDRAVIE